MAGMTAQEANMRHVLQRRGAASYHVKHSVVETTQFMDNWKNTYTPVGLRSLGEAVTSLPRLGVKTEEFIDSHSKPQEVVLCNAGLTSRVTVRSSTEVANTMHYLRPKTLLRGQQGAEWEAQVHRCAAEAAASHPTAGALTERQLWEKLGLNLPPESPGKASAPTRPGQSPEAGMTAKRANCQVLAGTAGASGQAGVGGADNSASAANLAICDEMAFEQEDSLASTPKEASLATLAKAGLTTPERPGAGRGRRRAGACRLRAERSDLAPLGSQEPPQKKLRGRVVAREVTAEDILAGLAGNVQADICHARQRLPGFKNQLSMFEYEKQLAHVENLEGAVQLSPACVSALAKEAARAVKTEKKGGGQREGADLPWAHIPNVSIEDETDIFKRRVFPGLCRSTAMTSPAFLFREKAASEVTNRGRPRP